MHTLHAPLQFLEWDEAPRTSRIPSVDARTAQLNVLRCVVPVLNDGPQIPLDRTAHLQRHDQARMRLFVAQRALTHVAQDAFLFSKHRLVKQ